MSLSPHQKVETQGINSLQNYKEKNTLRPRPSLNRMNRDGFIIIFSLFYLFIVCERTTHFVSFLSIKKIDFFQIIDSSKIEAT